MEQTVPMPARESVLAPKIRALRARLPQRRRVATVAAGLAGALLLLWLLAVHTPLAHPRDVVIKGTEGGTAKQITAALDAAAREQSTFAVDEAALLQAVADYPEVAAVRASAHPPMRLDLTVVMRLPVATVETGGRQVAVAADGTLLTRAVEAKLPALDASLGDTSLRDGRLQGDRDALRLLAAAPAPLLEMGRTVRSGRSGLELELARGPRLIFGNAEAAAEKWAAAAAVIADGSAANASYIDLRVPARPAVGGLGGSRTAGAEAPPTLAAGAAAAADAPVATTPAPIAPAATGAPATGAASPAQTPAAPAQVAPPQTRPAPEAETSAASSNAPASGGAALTP